MIRKKLKKHIFGMIAICVFITLLLSASFSSFASDTSEMTNTCKENTEVLQSGYEDSQNNDYEISADYSENSIETELLKFSNENEDINSDEIENNSSDDETNAALDDDSGKDDELSDSNSGNSSDESGQNADANPNSAMPENQEGVDQEDNSEYGNSNESENQQKDANNDSETNNSSQSNEGENSNKSTNKNDTEAETSTQDNNKNSGSMNDGTTGKTNGADASEVIEETIGKDITNVGGSLKYWPLPSAYGTDCISSGYGTRTLNGVTATHRGLDIAAPEGTPIYAADAGTVIISEFSDSAGNWVVIDHGNGIYSEYMHMSVRQCSIGDTVKAGQQIGLVGSTGDSTGPHLHFGIVVSDSGYTIANRVDPTPYILGADMVTVAADSDSETISIDDAKKTTEDISKKNKTSDEFNVLVKYLLVDESEVLTEDDITSFWEGGGHSISQIMEYADVYEDDNYYYVAANKPYLNGVATAKPLDADFAEMNNEGNELEGKKFDFDLDSCVAKIKKSAVTSYDEIQLQVLIPTTLEATSSISLDVSNSTDAKITASDVVTVGAYETPVFELVSEEDAGKLLASNIEIYANDGAEKLTAGEDFYYGIDTGEIALTGFGYDYYSLSVKITGNTLSESESELALETLEDEAEAEETTSRLHNASSIVLSSAVSETAQAYTGTKAGNLKNLDVMGYLQEDDINSTFTSLFNGSEGKAISSKVWVTSKSSNWWNGYTDICTLTNSSFSQKSTRIGGINDYAARYGSRDTSSYGEASDFQSVYLSVPESYFKIYKTASGKEYANDKILSISTGKYVDTSKYNPGMQAYCRHITAEFKESNLGILQKFNAYYRLINRETKEVNGYTYTYYTISIETSPDTSVAPSFGGGQNQTAGVTIKLAMREESQPVGVTFNKVPTEIDGESVSVFGAVYRLQVKDDSDWDNTNYAFVTAASGKGYVYYRFNTQNASAETADGWHVTIFKTDSDTVYYEYKDKGITYVKNCRITLAYYDNGTVTKKVISGKDEDGDGAYDASIVYWGSKEDLSSVSTMVNNVYVKYDSDDTWPDNLSEKMRAAKLIFGDEEGIQAGKTYRLHEVATPVNGFYELSEYTDTFKPEDGESDIAVKGSDPIKGRVSLTKVSLPSEYADEFCMAGAVYPIYTSAGKIYSDDQYYYGFKYYHSYANTSGSHTKCQILAVRCDKDNDTSVRGNWKAISPAADIYEPVSFAATTNAETGKAQTADYATALPLDNGDYYIQELLAPTSGHYCLNDEKKSFTISSSKTASAVKKITATDNFGLDPIGILLTKSAEMPEGYPPVGAILKRHV